MDRTPTEVLLVEDQPGDARLVELSLATEPAGEFRLRRAHRISEAVAALRDRPSDVVLLDLGLPDSKGFEGLEAVLGAAPSAAVVVLSGSEDPDLVGEAIGHGAVEYEVKGLFPRGVLGQVIRAALILRRVRTDLARPRESSAEHLSGLDQLSDAVVVVEGTRIRFANRAFLRVFGSVQNLPAVVRSAASAFERRPTAREGENPAGAVWGDGVALGEGDRKAGVRYVAESVRAGPTRSFLVRIRPREAKGTGSGLGGDATWPGWVPPGSSARTVSAEDAVLDPAVWAGLHELAGGDAAFVPQLLEAFRSYGEQLVESLRASGRGDERENWQTAAHTLKSTSAQVGATRLAELCRELESAVRAGRAPEARALALAVELEFRKVLVALAERSSSPTGASVPGPPRPRPAGE